MKRIALSALSVFIVTALLGLTGCESGGVDEGIPKDTTPAISPVDMSKMADMKSMPKAPDAAATKAAEKEAATPEKK